MYMRHNTHDSFDRIPAGAVPAGTPVLFRFHCAAGSKVILRTWWDNKDSYHTMKENREQPDLYEISVKMPGKPGLYWYYFIVTDPKGQICYYANQKDLLGGEGAVYDTVDDMPSFQITIYDQTYRTPQWLQGANIYQIFPDRFCKAPTKSIDVRRDRHLHDNWYDDVVYDEHASEEDATNMDFFGGTLTGIEEKLPYLKDLGVDIIYLNPIFEARTNHRYDTADYSHIDPLLGTKEEFEHLCRAAEEMGIRLLLDGVFSHTGYDSVYFNRFGKYDSVGAWQSKDSPYASWYTFRQFPHLYRCWWNILSLPECRKDDPSYRRFMFNEKDGIVPFWIHSGAGGWRLDVADELSMDFLRELRKAVKKENPDAAIIGEVWEDASNKISYGEMRCYCTGDTLDSVMNYPLRDGLLSFMTGKTDAHAFARLIHHQREVYPLPFLNSLMNLLGSHDRARSLNMLCGLSGEGMTRKQQKTVKLTAEQYELAKERYKRCLTILTALPGCPTVYYGDEAGLTGCTDPFCRGSFPWGREDKDLQSFVRDTLRARRESELLCSGDCEVTAVDADTIRIRRFRAYWDGRTDEKVIEVKRV